VRKFHVSENWLISFDCQPLFIINQKEYLSWINGAKKDETKQKRLEATL
jgi:uncharacterized protein YdeI (YjbR/CyaY-like superfamily)